MSGEQRTAAELVDRILEIEDTDRRHAAAFFVLGALRGSVDVDEPLTLDRFAWIVDAAIGHAQSDPDRCSHRDDDGRQCERGRNHPGDHVPEEHR